MFLQLIDDVEGSTVILGVSKAVYLMLLDSDLRKIVHVCTVDTT